MSATVQSSAHSWAAAHRVLLTVATTALALAVALTIALLVTRTTAEETTAPGGSIDQYPTERLGHDELPPGYRNNGHLGPLPR